tara:strand:+ start:1548 stop:3080 length:1533 start_codon:yes stop_codon:yes gene_type:complete
MAETKAKPKVDPQKFMGSKSTKGSGASMEGVDPKNINEVSRTLFNINNTLKGIVEILDSQLKLDKKEKKEDDTDAARALDAKKKKGAENFLELDTKESKEKTKKTSKLAEGAKGILNRLFTALTAIFSGWLIDKGMKMMKFLQEGDTESFKKMGMEVVKALGIVAGIFALLNIGPIISAITGITGALAAGMPAIMALLANPWTWAALGLIAGIAGTVIVMKTIVEAIQTRAAGGEEFLQGFNRLKAGLEEDGIVVQGSGKKEKFYVAPIKNQGGSKNKRTVDKIGTPKQKKAVAKYIEKRDALIQIRDNMRAEMKKKEQEIKKEYKNSGKRKERGQKIKESKSEIREKYTKKIDALFSGELDISTIEGVSDETKEELKGDDVDKAEKDLEVMDKATNGDTGEKVDTSKLLNKGVTYKEDGLESTGFTMTQADLDASKQKQSNAEKVKEISNNPANEIEVIPTSTSSGNTQKSAVGEKSMDSGEASSVPALKTNNDGNEYGMLFSHTYQQG